MIAGRICFLSHPRFAGPLGTEGRLEALGLALHRTFA